jgi:hypothetical protein
LVNIAGAQNVATPEAAAQKVEIRNVEVKGNEVSGELVNKSRYRMRNVELLVQYHWLWQNEFKPGGESPGKTIVVNLDKELPPGASMPFKATLDAPPPRTDGRYMTEVTVAGFTEIIPPTVASR